MAARDVSEPVRLAFRDEGARIAAGELARRRGLLASLEPAGQQTVATTAYRLAEALVGCLLREAGTEARLADALGSLYAEGRVGG